jgi:hypothetical protein
MFGCVRSTAATQPKQNIMSKNTKPKAAKKTATAKKPAADKPKVVRVTKNEVTRPKAGGNTARVWEIADEITEKQGTPAIRKDVIEKGEKAQIPVATITTQYNLWRVFNGLKGRLAQPKVKAPKVKLPKPPAKAKGKIGADKPAKKLPKPPAKKAAPATAPAPEAAPAPAAE